MPGEITSTLSAGTNALLGLGATPYTSPQDVLDALGIESATKPEPDLGPDAAQVLERLREFAVGADELQRSTGLDAAQLAAALTELELVGGAGEVFRARG